MEEMDLYDRKLLGRLQEGLPITERPYLAVGDELGLSEDEVIDRLGRLMEKKIIRRLAGFFNSVELGYKTVLCAARVRDEDIDAFAELLKGYPGVTHNYVRDHESLNVWFTLISPDMESEDRTVDTIEKSGLTGKVHRFYKNKLFKIHASFEV